MHNQDLASLLDLALTDNQTAPLETHLLAHSGLPGPWADLALLHAFADGVGAYLEGPDPNVSALETLLDRWAADDAPATDPRVSLPRAAALAYAQAALSRPDWWPDEIAKLHRLAADPRLQVREAVAAAMARLLAADPERAKAVLQCWADEGISPTFTGGRSDPGQIPG